MKFHKKLGVFEACKKVREDLFDTLRGSRRSLPADLAAAAAVVVVAAAVEVSAAVAAAAEDDYEDKDYPDAAVVIVAEHIYYLSPRLKFRSSARRGGHTTRRLSCA